MQKRFSIAEAATLLAKNKKEKMPRTVVPREGFYCLCCPSIIKGKEAVTLGLYGFICDSCSDQIKSALNRSNGTNDINNPGSEMLKHGRIQTEVQNSVSSKSVDRNRRGLEKAIERTWERLLKPGVREVHFWNDRKFVICWRSGQKQELEVRFRGSSIRKAGKLIVSAAGTQKGLREIIEFTHATFPYTASDVSKYKAITGKKVNSTATNYFDGGWVQKSRARIVR